MYWTYCTLEPVKDWACLTLKSELHSQICSQWSVSCLDSYMPLHFIRIGAYCSFYGWKQLNSIKSQDGILVHCRLTFPVRPLHQRVARPITCRGLPRVLCSEFNLGCLISPVRLVIARLSCWDLTCNFPQWFRQPSHQTTWVTKPEIYTSSVSVLVKWNEVWNGLKI